MLKINYSISKYTHDKNEILVELLYPLMQPVVVAR
jgi:hypothetical protein